MASSYIRLDLFESRGYGELLVIHRIEREAAHFHRHFEQRPRIAIARRLSLLASRAPLEKTPATLSMLIIAPPVMVLFS
jgi:hypothetical protein